MLTVPQAHHMMVASHHAPQPAAADDGVNQGGAALRVWLHARRLDHFAHRLIDAGYDDLWAVAEFGEACINDSDIVVDEADRPALLAAVRELAAQDRESLQNMMEA